MPSSPERSARSGVGAAGYSLAEVVVSLSLFIAILVGVLFFFNLNYRQARGRGDTAQRQEELRGAQHDLARLARIAARGGLPHELAIEIASDVAAGTRIGGPDSPRVVAGTDVLTVRGVFSTPLLRVGPADGGLRTGGAGAPATGTVEIHDPSPQTGAGQSLSELAATLEARESGSDALLLVSQLDESIFAVVTSDLGEARIFRDGDRVTAVDLAFGTSGPTAALAGAGAAAALRGGAFVGILEEYRFYVRQAYAAPGDESSAPRPQLSVSRFVPGTDRLWDEAAGGRSVDLVDNVGGLQVSLATDADGELRVAIELESG